MFAKAVCALLLLLATASAFVAPAVSHRVSRPTSALRMADVVFPGGKKAQGKAGESLKAIAKKAKYNAPYGCEEGKCGTCEHKVGGKKIRLCIGKLPAGNGPFTFTQ